MSGGKNEEKRSPSFGVNVFLPPGYFYNGTVPRLAPRLNIYSARSVMSVGVVTERKVYNFMSSKSVRKQSSMYSELVRN